MDEADYYRTLVKRYISKEANKEELEVFSHLMAQGILQPYLYEAMTADASITPVDEMEYLATASNKNKTQFKYKWLSYAAAILLVGLGTFYTVKHRPRSFPATHPIQAAIPPGTHRATLVLANGKTIALDSSQTGIVIKDKSIQYNDGTRLHGEGESAMEAGNYQAQLKTPKGGEYLVVLSDGTKVWLNSQTTISYPNIFTGDQREVFLDGEAYFDVAPYNGKQGLGHHPFIVKSKGQEIKVLGTEFNVSAFQNDNKIKTTLVSGAIKVANEASESHTIEYAILNPGEQSILSASGAICKIKVNIADEIAWKEGLFRFKNAGIQDVMKQLSRWYDVEVVYDGEIPKAKIDGEVYRNMNLQQVFEVLSGLEINIRQLGKKIIVSGKS